MLTIEQLGDRQIELISDFPERDKDRIKMIAGANYSIATRKWTAPLTWATCRAARGIFADQLVVGPDLNAWAARELERQIWPAEALRLAWDAPGDVDLYPFQRAGVDFMAFAQWCLLLDEMGSGKTIQAIRALAKIVREGGNPFPAVVVCPNNMVRTWARELTKWFPGLSVGVIRGTIARRRAVLSEAHHVYVINWEGVRSHSRLAPYGSVRLKRCIVCDPMLADVPANSQTRCHRCPKELNSRPWTTVIADEAHKMQDPKSLQTRAVWALRTDETAYRFAMTGTAIDDNPADMWGALHFIDPISFPSKSRFTERYCLTSYNPFGGLEVHGVRPDTSQELFEIIDSRMRRMPKEAVLPFLPKKTYSERIVEMSPKQAKAYGQMANGMMADIDGTVLVAGSAMTQLGRLSALASSFVEVTTEQTINAEGELIEKQHVTAIAPSCKIDALMEIDKELAGQSAVVAAMSPSLLHMAKEKLGDRASMIIGGQHDDERDKAMQDFQEGRVQYCLVSIQAGGTGITLTRAGTLIRLERSWSKILDSQMENRVHRIGSEIHDKIQIIDILAEGTVDIGRQTVLDVKGERLEEIMRDRETLARLVRGEVV